MKMSTNYENYSKEELIEKLHHYEELINTLKAQNQNNELLNFPWIGNLGTWYFMIPENKVFFNPKKVTALGYSIEEIPKNIGYEFFTDKLHPDDYDRVMENMRTHLLGKSEAYEVEYRIKNKFGTYNWYYDRGVVTKRATDGSPLIVSGIVFDITENKKMEEKIIEQNKKLKYLAEIDELTNIYNRRKTLFTLKNLLNKSTFSLIMFDIDNFKQINDNYGHDVGDEVLKSVSKTISDNLKKNHYLGRIGGEEFLIILLNCKLDSAIQYCNRYKDSLNSINIIKNKKITASFGIVEYKGESEKELLKKVDELMYEAKKSGKIV
jgi:diguanylate cyclase (GGDEF)-like protein/PAS domain S-box-containing protein